jgi:hypothetical protein
VVASRRKNRQYNLKKRYNITPKEYQVLKRKQNHKCKICNKRKPLVIDHDHKTNKLRNLLCSKCNLALGLVKESTLVLKRMIKYINHHNKKQRSNKYV